MKIITALDRPPIADRRFDWSAWVIEDETLCANGPTEQEAIEALYELIAMNDMENEQ